MLTLMTAIIILKDVINLFICLLPLIFLIQSNGELQTSRMFCFLISKLSINKYLLGGSRLLC